MLSWTGSYLYRLTNLLVSELSDIASLVTKSYPMSVILPLWSFTYVEDNWVTAWKLWAFLFVLLLQMIGLKEVQVYVYVYVCVCVCVHIYMHAYIHIHTYIYISVCAGQINNLFHQAKQLWALLKVNIKEYCC